MKIRKVLFLVLTAAMLLSLCACGETVTVEKEVEVPVEVTVVPEEYQKYQDLVDALEAGDYDSALALIDGMDPAKVLPPITEVEITEENFLDYFEYVELPEQGRSKHYDSKGNFAMVALNSGYYLKDGYTIAAEKAGDCRLEVGLKYGLYWYYNRSIITTDLENATYKAAGKAKYIMDCDRMCSGSYVNYIENTAPYYYIFVASTILAPKSGSTCLVPEDGIEIVSVSGTLYLYE